MRAVLWKPLPPIVRLPFLKPVYCRVKSENKPKVKGQECYALRTEADYAQDFVRMLTRYRTVLVTRNITW